VVQPGVGALYIIGPGGITIWLSAARRLVAFDRAMTAATAEENSNL
jgi:hypothetical protein